MDTIRQIERMTAEDLNQFVIDAQEILAQIEVDAALNELMSVGATVGLSKKDLEEMAAAGIEIDLSLATFSETFSNYQAACESFSHNQKVGLIATAVAGLLALLAWISKKVWDYFKNKKKEEKASDKVGVKVTEITICTYKELESESSYKDTLNKIEEMFGFITEKITADTIASAIKGKNKDEAVAAINKEFGEIFKGYAADILKDLKVSPDASKSFRENVAKILEAGANYKMPFDGEVDVDLDIHYEIPKGLKDEMEKSTKHLEKLASSKEGLVKGFFMKDAEKFVSAEIVAPSCRFATYLIRTTFIPFLQEAARMNTLLDRTDGLLAKFAAPAVLDSNRNSKNEKIADAFRSVNHDSLQSILKAYGGIKDADIPDMFHGSHGAYLSYMNIIKQSEERAEKKK